MTRRKIFMTRTGPEDLRLGRLMENQVPNLMRRLFDGKRPKNLKSPEEVETTLILGHKVYHLPQDPDHN